MSQQYVVHMFRLQEHKYLGPFASEELAEEAKEEAYGNMSDEDWHSWEYRIRPLVAPGALAG